VHLPCYSAYWANLVTHHYAVQFPYAALGTCWVLCKEYSVSISSDYRVDERAEASRSIIPGSDLTPCNAPPRTRKTGQGGNAGGVAFEFPMHGRPTTYLDKNLAYRGLVEILYSYPLDRVVLSVTRPYGLEAYQDLFAKMA
jgi:hypothetical protein